jgi:hypothetical protein
MSAATDTKPKRGRPTDGKERVMLSLYVLRGSADKFKKLAQRAGKPQAWFFNETFAPDEK